MLSQAQAEQRACCAFRTVVTQPEALNRNSTEMGALDDPAGPAECGLVLDPARHAHL
jgi:hypothetical protein